MVKVEESDLPGVGKKYTFKDREMGEDLVVILHNDGMREIYSINDEECTNVITLNDEESRELGAVLAGIYYRPKIVEDLRAILSDLAIEWYKLPKGSPVVNYSIGDLNIRKKTGVSIIAIIRNERVIPNPTPEIRLEAGDMLIAIGTKEEHLNFKKMIYEDY